MEQDRAAQSSDSHHEEAQIRMEQDRQHVPESDLNGAAHAEKGGTDIGGAATGVTYQDGVMWYGNGSVHRWAKLDIG